MTKNLYDELGVSKKATQQEIRNAYKKLALENHPDKNPGNPYAEEKFKAIGHAYSILSDPESRQKYDNEYQPQPASSNTMNGTIEAAFTAYYGICGILCGIVVFSLCTGPLAPFALLIGTTATLAYWSLPFLINDLKHYFSKFFSRTDIKTPNHTQPCQSEESLHAVSPGLATLCFTSSSKNSSHEPIDSSEQSQQASRLPTIQESINSDCQKEPQSNPELITNYNRC